MHDSGSEKRDLGERRQLNSDTNFSTFDGSVKTIKSVLICARWLTESHIPDRQI